MPKFAQPSDKKEFTLPKGSKLEPKGVLKPYEMVKVLLSKEDSVFEKRIQAISFAAELEWLANEETPNDLQLTSATYQRAPRGIYSQDIRQAISQVENIYSRIAYSQGHRTRKWDTSQVGNLDISTENEEAHRIIESVYEAASGISDEDLMTWCLTIDNVSGLDTGEEIDLEHVSNYL